MIAVMLYNMTWQNWNWRKIAYVSLMRLQFLFFSTRHASVLNITIENYPRNTLQNYTIIVKIKQVKLTTDN